MAISTKNIAVTKFCSEVLIKDIVLIINNTKIRLIDTSAGTHILKVLFYTLNLVTRVYNPPPPPKKKEKVKKKSSQISWQIEW